MLNIYNRKTINHRNSECDKARLERRRGDVQGDGTKKRQKPDSFAGNEKK